MNSEISASHIERWLLVFAERILEKQDYLTDLDAAIGDGDHGLNMARGVVRLRERLGSTLVTAGRHLEPKIDADGEKDAPENIGVLLRTVAMTLISGVGGAAGALYGSFFLNAAKEAATLLKNGADPQRNISVDECGKIFRSGLEGLKQRGKAGPGEKTMIDAFEPAVNALQNAIADGDDAGTAFTAACRAAEKGMQETIAMQALKGRASYLGPRSIGHQDPGATSAFYLFEAAQKAFA
ncbi:MAG: dihydroxyacetone kinase subunit DhaL [Caldilineaceae bacterium]